MLSVVFFSAIITLIYPLLISREIVAHAELIIHNSKQFSPLFIKSSPVNTSPATRKDMEIIYKLKISNIEKQLKKIKFLILISGFFVLFVSSLPIITEITPLQLTVNEMSIVEGVSRFSSYFLVLIPIFFCFADIFIRSELISFLEGLKDADDKDTLMINTLMDTLSADKQGLKVKVQSYLNAVNSQKRALTKAEAKCICEFLTEPDCNEVCQPVFLA